MLLILSFIAAPISAEVDNGENESVPANQPIQTGSPSPAPRSTPTGTAVRKEAGRIEESYPPAGTPRPAVDPVIEVTVQLTLDSVMRWHTVVDYRMEDFYEFDKSLVLAIMANESGGDPYALSHAGACGLMQVIPQPWYRYSAEQICSNYSVNVAMGMWILHSAINIAQEQGYDWRYGLAYYNCSEQAVHEDRCGSHGGLNYADRVLNFWLPYVEERVAQLNKGDVIQ